MCDIRQEIEKLKEKVELLEEMTKLKERVAELERQLAAVPHSSWQYPYYPPPGTPWYPHTYYTTDGVGSVSGTNFGSVST